MSFMQYLLGLIVRPNQTIKETSTKEIQTTLFTFVGWFTLASIISALALLPNAFRALKSEAIFQVISTTIVSIVLAFILPLLIAIPIYLGFIFLRKKNYKTAFKTTLPALTITTPYVILNGILSGIVAWLNPFNPNTANLLDKTYPRLILLISAIALIASIVHAFLIAVLAGKEYYEVSWHKATLGVGCIFAILIIMVTIIINV